MKNENKYQNQEILNKKEQNNTSTEFCLPSEIKELWREVTSEDIIDVFGEYIENYSIFVPIIQTSFQILLSIWQNEINDRVLKVADLLNLGSNDKGKWKLNVKLLSIFQEFSSSIFLISANTESIITEFKKELITKWVSTVFDFV